MPDLAANLSRKSKQTSANLLAEKPYSYRLIIKIMYKNNYFLIINLNRASFIVLYFNEEQNYYYEEDIMKSYRKELWFETTKRRAFINITPEIQDSLNESGIKEGLLLCNAMHITASVFINDNESGLHQDFEKWLEKLAPEKPHSQYAHNGFEDNADAHLKRQVMGREVVVAISNGKLDFGPWEQIFYGEFDGKRRKRVLLKIIGE